MVYTYIDANMNPAVTYYADKKRFGRDEDITSQQATSSKDQARKTQEDAAVTRDGEQQRTNKQQQQQQHTFGPTLEQKFRQYLAAFDGKKKDFSEVEHLFDALFHQNFCDAIHYRQEAPQTREQVKALHARYFAMGTKAKLLDYRRVGLKTIDVSYHLFNDEEDIVTRQLITRKNRRVIRTQQLSYQKVSLNTDDVSDGKQFVKFNVIENSSSSYMKARWNSNAYREMAGLILSL